MASAVLIYVRNEDYLAEWPERCACGASWSLEQWRELKLLGQWQLEERLFELRQCRCKSTLATELRTPKDEK